MPASYIVTIVCIYCTLAFGESLQSIRSNPTNESNAPDAVLPPSEDPWYTAPAELVFSYPGDVIKIRNSPGNLTSILKNLKFSTQILYRTTTGQSHQRYPAHAVTTVLVPKKSDPFVQDALSYQVPYESASPDASPSYSLATGSKSIRFDLLDRMLERGWLVVVPDYESTMASFGAARLAGQATLDSLKAVRSVGTERFGLAPQPDVALWGYSGGALATAWAHVLRPVYAFDLPICAVSLGGLPANLLHMIERSDGTAASGLVFNAIAGLSNEYPELDQQVALAARRNGRFNVSAFTHLKTMSSLDSMAHFAYHNVSDYFTGGLNRLLPDHVRRIFDRDLSLLREPNGQSQIYMYHGINDEIAPIEDVDAIFNKWCRTERVLFLFSYRYQTQIVYHRHILGGHQAVGELGIDHALQWITAEFLFQHEKHDNIEINDHPFQCEIRNVTMIENFTDLDKNNRTA